MFANFTTRPNNHGRRRLTAGLPVVVSLLFLLAISSPAGASTASLSGGITPVGAVPGTTGPKLETTSKHPGGALLPKKQVDAVRTSRMLAATLPASVDLSSYSVPVGNQGAISSCVAWTIDYAMLGWYSRHDNRPGQPFHPMYTYSQIHLDNSAGGGGSYADRALNVAVSQGNDTMAHYSHSTTDFISQPNASERANAANWRISGWQTLYANTNGSGGGSTGSTLIKTALANGKPVAIALPIRPGFDNMPNSPTTLDDDITGSFSSRGYHEVMATGYDQYGLWIQNSWGTTTWGYKGYGRLSWRVVGNDVYQAHTISGFATSSIDTIPPTVTAPLEQIDVPNKITSTTVPVKLTWSGSDASGIAAYELETSTNGGGYVRDTTVMTQTLKTYALTIGSRYQFRVRAKDTAGNWSAYQYSQSLTAGMTDEKIFSPLGGSWARYSWASAFGGTAITSSFAGDWVQLSFTGRDVALVAPTFSTGGRANVYCDGTYMGLVDLYASTTSGMNTVFWCRFAQSTAHTMKIVLEGTSGRPRFDVDAFAILS